MQVETGQLVWLALLLWDWLAVGGRILFCAYEQKIYLCNMLETNV